jgi:tRNA pseudouridine32 synthase/23S rRNA pseudouridine746 synthase
VSGLVLFARSAEAHRHISDWFERRRVKKVYEALTSGDRQGEALSETWNTWTCRMARGKKRAYLADFGKPAETLARCVGERVVQGVTLLAWELFPKTGRPHQLRFELARRQWPIAGDTLYGSTTRWREGEIALRARRLDFGECPEFARWGLPQTIECLSWQEREGDQE